MEFVEGREVGNYRIIPVGDKGKVPVGFVLDLELEGDTRSKLVMDIAELEKLHNLLGCAISLKDKCIYPG